MAGKNGLSVVQVVQNLAAPVAEEFGLTLWDVVFEKEGADWYLRIFIDRPDSQEGISIDDCENVSRRLDILLDQADPIEQSYILEVSSPGVERKLTRDKHFELMAGREVVVRMIRPLNGEKELRGILQEFENGEIVLERSTGNVIKINKSDTAFVKLYENWD